MKRLLSLVLVLCMMITFVGCTGSNEEVEVTEPVAEESVEATEGGFILPPKEEEVISYDDVNELEPVDGWYQIHSIVGIQNIANHLDAKFNILCDIDLGGATLEPIGSKDAPFTGQIKGNEFTISNFTIEQPTADGDLGFFGVNDGVILQLQLGNMTLIASEKTVRIGGLAGTNTGRLQRCKVEGTLTVDAAGADVQCGGAVGVNTKELKNSEADLDIFYNAAGAANIGGLVGHFTEGVVSDSDALGQIVVADGKDKNIGLFAGYAKDTEVLRAVFLGENNRIGGELFNNFIGLSENAVVTEGLWRDNDVEEIPADIRAIREKAVQAMYDMGTIEWTVNEIMGGACHPSCKSDICHSAFIPGMIYRGVPYRHQAGSLDRMMYCLDENNVMEDWVFDWGTLGGYQNYMGSSCYIACQLAWATVANSMSSPNSMQSVIYSSSVGTIPVGDWGEKWPEENRVNDAYTSKVKNYMTEQELYDCYAQIRAGDVLTHVASNGAHSFMACTDAVVVRDAEGNIDPNESYIYDHEQGGDQNPPEGVSSSWGIWVKKPFTRLYGDSDLPVTIEEFLVGESEVPEAHIENGMDGLLGLTTGMVSSNFYVDSVTMVITDAQGNEVLNKKMFTRVEKITDYNEIGMYERYFVHEFDLANFTSTVLELGLEHGASYNATITANLMTFDKIVVKDYSFVA
ncbi:MAG: hypothetical protein IJO45_00965 [Oscillospiraceae bacterium]|nr:hypothetical protein [Oscillospiraceae bacterium]